MKKLLLILIVIALVFSVGCTKYPQKVATLENGNSKYLVQATNYPIHYFAQRIAGDKIIVDNFIPLGVDPHSWEPTPKDMVRLELSDILLYNGVGMEGWIANIAEAMSDNSKLQFIDTSEGIALLKGTDHDYDPHIWLDPISAQTIANNIKQALVNLDSENKIYYEENYVKLIDELDKLDNAIKDVLNNISKDVFIVNHASFGYLAARYDLRQISIMGINPHIEPTPKKMIEIINLTKEMGIEYIFTENLVSSKVAQVLAGEAGIQTLVLNPLGNLSQKDIQEGKNYFSIMYDNLEVLRKGLE